MLEKALVLNGNKGVHQILRYAIIALFIRLCRFIVVRYPYAVEHTVQALVFGVVALAVISVYGCCEVEL